MRKPLLLLAVMLVGGGWLFFKYFDVSGLDGLRIQPRSGENAAQRPAHVPPPVQRAGDTIRIASFSIQVFSETKAGKPHVMEYLARIVRQFDVVAIQDIRSRNQDLLPQLVDVVNAAGAKYDYVIGPRLGRSSTKTQLAFVFDTASVEVDRNQMYTIDDPDDLMHREPLVAWFRVRGPAEGAAFTFTLVNVQVDPEEVDEELAALAEVYRVVRDDGRGEDDVILLGDFQADHRSLGPLGGISGMMWVVAGVPTDTRQTAQTSNLVFHRMATSEFTGRGGVYDFMREMNLTLEQALEVSDQLPVWAEFSIYEGGQPGRVATATDGAPH